MATVPKPASADTRLVAQSLAAVRGIGKDAVGYEDAEQAMQALSLAKARDLPAILAGVDGATPLAANWIRNAFETVADRALRQHELPAKALEAFLLDRSHDPRARRLAYEWILKVDPTAHERLIPQMLLDPGSELRRDAVAMRIDEAAKIDKQKDKAHAVRLYREALSGAVHDDQVKTIVQALSGLGVKCDVSKHFAFLTRFSMIGPFDNRGGKGLNAVYPPETDQRLDAVYEGQIGKVSWQSLSTTNEYGIVDIAKQVKPYKGAVMYALAEFHSPRERLLELRLGTQNAWKIWVNGQFLFARDEYHRGMIMDQYRVPVLMRPGKNIILLKICQNEQKEDWAQSYQFQLRVCDANGSGVRSLETTVSGGKP